MPYTFEDARKAISDNPVNMFQLENPELVRRVLQTDYPEDSFTLGEYLAWQHKGEAFERKCWVGDPLDPARKLLRREPITVEQVTQLVRANVISPVKGSIAHQIHLDVVLDGTAEAHYEFSAEAWPTFNSVDPQLWMDETSLPRSREFPIEHVPYEFQEGLHAHRYWSKTVAECALLFLNSHAARDLARLGLDWFVEHRLFKGARGRIDGYYWAPSLWPVSAEEFELRAHIVGTPVPKWHDLVPTEHRRLMTEAEMNALPNQNHW